MKIAATDTGRLLSRLPARSPQTRQQRAKEARGTAGKTQHVLHGWRVLTAPVVTQVLLNYSGTPGTTATVVALDAYRKAGTGSDETPTQLLREI